MGTTFASPLLGLVDRTPADPRERAQRGFILIPVLWVMLLITLIAAILTRTAATDVRANANLLRRAEGEVLSDGLTRLAIRYALARGVDGNMAGEFQLDGTPRMCVVGGAIATIAIDSTAALVDLNTASLDTLERLFTGVGAPSPTNLAAAVTDFRDADDTPSMGGAELAEYKAAGLQHGPKNGPFQSVGELDQVLGMTPEIFARVRPFVTIRSGLGSPDAGLASSKTLSWSIPTDVSNGRRTRYLRFRVSVRPPGAARQYTREATVLLERRVSGGFLVKSWERIDEHIGPAGYVDGSGLPHCVAALLAVN